MSSDNQMLGYIFSKLNARTAPCLSLFLLVPLLTISLFLNPQRSNAQGESPPFDHLVEVGDTWTALAWRYGKSVEDLQSSNPHINRQRQPVIGQIIDIPSPILQENNGSIRTENDGGILQLAVAYDLSPWEIVSLNHIKHPYRPLLFKPIFLRGGIETPKQYPAGFQSLQLSQTPAHPGQGLAIRAQLDEDLVVNSNYSNVPIATYVRDQRLVGLFGTGAFFNPGDHELAIRSVGNPLWSQPWRMVPGEWTFEEITLTGEAAAIDAESIRQERERLMAIWGERSAEPLWKNVFAVPISDYLSESSQFGARRSYNGGPYGSYHEGVDYSAYAGTAVHSPAEGTIVLAERLYVRGGAVIIDHGLGIFSGFYHLSEVLGEVGQMVEQGQIIGRVGTTGLSTGNHLHWDLLVSGTWVDGNAWLESGTACWLLEGWGKPCLEG